MHRRNLMTCLTAVFAVLWTTSCIEQAQSAGCEAFFLKTDPGDAILGAVRRVLSAVPAA